MKNNATPHKFWWFAQLLGLVFVLAAGAPSWAQTMDNLAVRASATVRLAPPQIKLTWPADAQASGYTIYRKTPTADAWGSSIGTVAAGANTATEFADNNVAVGTAYEYRITKTGANFSGEGYVLAGIEVPAVENRGKLVLLVADTHAAYLAPDLAQLEQDLVGDGWQVLRHNVPAAYTPPQVRALVLADYQADPTRVQAVFVLGHVAVPYSGLLNPDGHGDHLGAWPADAYYGNMDGTWTDTQVNDVSASRPENRNVPGDGKFDQLFIASDVKLQVGRVDLSNLPAFAPLTERDLLRRYLLKDHRFRHKVYTVAERGLISDNFGTFGGEAFANNGWRNFSALVGAGQVTAGDYFNTLGAQDYLWAYGCGGGWYSGAGGVGSTNDYANRVVKSVFNLAFGSYFGDWDSQDNFLRAALAADGYALTNAWAGRPNWHFHHMGLGETIGYSARLTQNNYFLYATNYGARFVHVGLMGDPSLRQHVTAPAAGLTTTAGPGRADLRWTASPQPVAGYHVYRAAPGAPFVRLNAQPLPATATAFADAAPLVGAATYMVRALQLKQTPTGSYFNLSQGVFSTFQNTGTLATAPPVPAPSQLVLSLAPNPARTATTLTGAAAGTAVRVLDALGRVVATTTTDAVGTARLVLPAGRPAGVYLVRAGAQAVRLLVE